ncbi:MAG: sigma 54-interacting transcriptional regulator, partial [Acidobacteriota bacterium]|nr:sigma 54-interacting transcriptional regulator [Acidobacteriota bacterium]
AAGEIHLAAGRPDHASRDLESARSLLTQGGRDDASTAAQVRLARSLGDLGRPDEALRALDDVERRSTSDHAKASAALERGVLLVRSGDRLGAIESFGRAVRLSPPGSPLLARSRVARARCLVLVGRTGEAEQELAMARDRAEDHGLGSSIAMTKVQASLAGGRFRAVIDLLPPTRVQLLLRGDLDGLGMLHALAADAAAALVDLDRALELAHESLRWRRLQPHPRWLAPAYVRLARVHLLRGDLDAAGAAVWRARVAGRGGHGAAQVATLSVRSRLALVAGDASSALQHAQAAVARARQGVEPTHLAEALTCVAAARAADGDAGGSIAAAREALELYRRGGLYASVEAEALALYADSLSARDADQGVRLAERARDLAERSGEFDAGTLALIALERALLRSGSADRADLARRWAVARIEQAAARCTDPVARTTFMERPDRARVLEHSGLRDARRLETVYDIVSELNSLREPRLVVERLMDRALGVLGADRGAIVLGAEDGELEVALSRGVEPETEMGAVRLSKTILERARGGEAILALNPASDARFSGVASVRMFAISAVLCVPLRWRDDVVGAIYVDSRDPARRFDRQDLRFVEALADHAALALTNARAFDGLRTENARLRADLGRQDGLGPLVGRSLAMEQVFRHIEAAAPSGRPVLVLGESGTGKELVARTVHRLGPHPDGPFIDVNCAGVPKSILEATLFGYERGAFTDAVRSHKGLIEQASGGTLFLDEIGDMPLAMQKTLLRVIQEGELRRLGSTEIRTIEFRLVAATHRPLEELVADGRFREDLLYRIDVLRIVLPPLRERLEDLPLLARHLLERMADQFGPLELAGEMMEKLATWSWPGNVRELENVLTRLALHARSGRIDIEALSADPDLGGKLGAPPRTSAAGLRQVERDAIRRALLITGGNRVRAARLLGIGRATIFRKIRQYSLESVGREGSRRKHSV